MMTAAAQPRIAPGGQAITVSDGEVIFYRHWPAAASAGPVRRILLIHPLAMDSSIWRYLADAVAGQAELLALDCRGHGQSSKPGGPYTLERFADDAAEIMDQQGWADAIVVGCSMGGCVAQAFANAHPDRTKGLVLIDTTAWYGPEAPRNWAERGEKALTAGLGSMVAFQKTRWFGDAFRENFPKRVEAAVDIFLANDPHAYAATCDMLGQADLRAALGELNMPAAVIVGEEDYATPVSHSEALAEAIPGASLHILKQARHMTPVECPEDIAGILLGGKFS